MTRVFVHKAPEQFCTCRTQSGFTSNPDYSEMPEAKNLWVCARCGWPTRGGWKGYIASRKQQQRR